MAKNQVSNIIIDASQGVLCTEIFQDEPRKYTPTGKISHAKTRVYTQRYRKEWEQMPDFKGWLTSVPSQVTRAFCTYCRKNLHAHRLSLLKHTCTMKHQRAALMFQTRLQIKRNSGDDDTASIVEFDPQFESLNVDAIKKTDDEDEDENEMEYIVERLDVEDEESDEELIDQRINDHDSDTEKFEEVSSSKKLKLEADDHKDALAQAMIHVHDDYLDVTVNSNVSDNNLEVITGDLESHEDHNENENERDNQDNNKMNDIEIVENTKDEFNSEKIENSTFLNAQNADESNANNKVTITKVQNKTIMLSTGKTVTLTTGKLPGYVLSKVKSGNLPTLIVAGSNNKNYNLRPIAPKTIPPIPSTLPSSSTPTSSTSTAGTSNQSKKFTMTTKNVTIKPTCISTHVLDTSKGLPVGGLQVSLYKLLDGRWTFLNESTTSPNGRCNDLVDITKTQFTAGRYKLHFDVDKYFSLRRIETMFPFIEIVFDVKNPTGNHHIPILLTPFGYTTYRGIDR